LTHAFCGVPHFATQEAMENSHEPDLPCASSGQSVDGRDRGCIGQVPIGRATGPAPKRQRKFILVETNKKYPFSRLTFFAQIIQPLATGLEEVAVWRSQLDRLSTDGAAILNDALAWIDCAVEEILPRHGQAIVIGPVRAIVIRSNGHPLLYWQGAYQ
jgi:hypothetical protein